MSRPDWLFLTCPARSGSTLIFSLLDAHPDIVIWPFEFRYFQEFFVKLTGDAETASSTMLAENFLPLAKRFHEEKFSTFYSSIDVAGAVDAEGFEKRISGIQERQVTAEEFLSEIYDLYRASIKEAPAAPRYNLVKTMIKGFDWRNTELIERSRFLSMRRPMETRYASQRFKFIDKFECGPVETFERCIRLFFEMKLAEELTDRYAAHPNFMYIDLSDMQSDPDAKMQEVAAFLDLPFTESMVQPTFLGKPFGGHFHDPKLNKGGVRKVESKHSPLTGYETRLLEAMHQREIPEDREMKLLEAKALEEDIPQLFPGVTGGELGELKAVLPRFRAEVKLLMGETLMDMSYLEWKRNHPHIQ